MHVLPFFNLIGTKTNSNPLCCHGNKVLNWNYYRIVRITARLVLGKLKLKCSSFIEGKIYFGIKKVANIIFQFREGIHVGARPRNWS